MNEVKYTIFGGFKILSIFQANYFSIQECFSRQSIFIIILFIKSGLYIFQQYFYIAFVVV